MFWSLEIPFKTGFTVVTNKESHVITLICCLQSLVLIMYSDSSYIQTPKKYITHISIFHHISALFLLCFYTRTDTIQCALHRTEYGDEAHDVNTYFCHDINLDLWCGIVFQPTYPVLCCVMKFESRVHCCLACILTPCEAPRRLLSIVNDEPTHPGAHSHTET